MNADNNGPHRSQALYKKAKTLIPGGTQLLSKRPEMFLPDQWPSYYSKAQGCKLWDLDDREYLDMSYMGIGANILGYADVDVDEAVKSAIQRGNMSTLNVPEEVELAQLLIDLHPWADMVRYARTGGEALAIAVRIARAKSRRSVTLFCGYHGWHDWYLSANLVGDESLKGHLLPGLSPVGVPKELLGTSIPFTYNNTDEFQARIAEHGNELGVVVLETLRNFEPDPDFFNAIQEAREKYGFVLIMDEVSSGWRLNLGGAHLRYHLVPDIAVFGKGLGNGYAMSAIIGNKEVMQASQDSFISSTYWTEGIGPTAAIASIRKMEEKKVWSHLITIGRSIQEGWKKVAANHQLEIEVGGIYPLSHFRFKNNHLELKTLFTQLMLERGFLATTAFYASYAHSTDHVEQYLNATNDVFNILSDAEKKGNTSSLLKGPVCHSGFKRLT